MVVVFVTGHCPIGNHDSKRVLLLNDFCTRYNEKEEESIIRLLYASHTMMMTRININLDHYFFNALSDVTDVIPIYEVRFQIYPSLVSTFHEQPRQSKFIIEFKWPPLYLLYTIQFSTNNLFRSRLMSKVCRAHIMITKIVPSQSPTYFQKHVGNAYVIVGIRKHRNIARTLWTQGLFR